MNTNLHNKTQSNQSALNLKKMGPQVRSRDRYQDSQQEQDDEINMNNIDTDEENVEAIEDRGSFEGMHDFGKRNDFDQSPELQA